MSKPWVASYTHPIFQKAIHALEKGFGKKAAFIREGGSIPFVTQMYDTFKVPCILLGFGLPDENAHAPDEHIALEKGFGKRAVFIREGGSIPFVTQMYDTFKVPCILLGFGLPDENAHAPDEHIALENYFGGIKAVAEFYQGLGNL